MTDIILGPLVGGLLVESVAEPANRLDHVGGTCGGKLVPDTGDQDAHRFGREVAFFGIARKLACREHPAGVLGEGGEDVELPR